MWKFKFIGTPLAALALLGFVGGQPALAAYSMSSEFSSHPSQEFRGLGLDGSFQLAVMGNSGDPLSIPTETFPKKKAQPAKPEVAKPKATPKKASKPKKKKAKTAQVRKAPAKKPAVVPVKEEEGFLTKTLNTLIGSSEEKKNPASKSLVKKSESQAPGKEEEGLLTKTLSTLVGGDDKKDKKDAVSKPKPQKTAGKKPEPEKKEEGLLTKTLKSLVGGDEKKKDEKKEKTAKNNPLNPLNMAPPGSTSHKKEEEKPKTAKSETKQTLKDSFQKLIGVGAVDEAAIEKKPEVTKKAEVKKVAVEKKAPPKPKRITARKYIEQEDAQLNKDRGGAEKGKNVLKDSFQKLIADDDKQKALTK